MSYLAYVERRGQLQTYFDRTAADAWARLTSTEPVSRIRATVRAGRDTMRDTILGYLPADLAGARLLDAGCGTCALSVAAAERGAEVVAIDLSATLVALGQERVPAQLKGGRIDFKVGDMSDAALGNFDHVVAMDSLIHYPTREILDVLAGLAMRTTRSINFTFAPATPLLSTVHALGLWFPRANRAPAIVPVGQKQLCKAIAEDPRLADWRVGRSARIVSGFYTSQALELVRR
jgi:magnesium-protoporphyrin O-methyltransferase